MSIAYPPDREQSIHPSELLQKVQTIGYRQQNGLAEIERIMSADQSTILVDIRYSPKSSNLQWTQAAFKKKYQKRYIWTKALGNIHYNQPEKGIQIDNPDAGIQQLISLLHQHNVLLMCGCESYDQCHRKVVYELLQERLQDAGEVKATCFYVDDITEYPDTPLKYKKWCHLATTGSIDDLHAFAKSIGLKRDWFQDKPNHPHYDLTPGKRTAAIKHGAIAVSTIELIQACHPRLAAMGERVAEKIAESVKATCFSEESAPASTGNEETLRAENARLLAMLDFEREKHYQWRARCLYEQQPADPDAPDPQIIARIALDQEQELNKLRDYDTRQRETIAKALRIISKLWQREQQTRARIQERYHCTIDDLLNGPAKMVPLPAFNQEQEKRRQTEQQLEIINKLESNPKIKPAQEKFIRHVVNATKHGKHHDPEGRTRLNLKDIADRMAMSPSTAQRGIQFCKQLPDLFDIADYTETAPNGEETTRYYASVKPEALAILDKIEPLDFKKQGGDKYTCALCGSKHVRIKRQVIRTLVCDDCGKESKPLDDEEPIITYEYPNASYQKKDTGKNDAIIITSDPPAACTDNIAAAAKLLRAIAGDHNQHIEMSRSGEKKYYSVDRELTIVDLENHLKGGQAKGARCSHTDGRTRALCFDADDIDSWTILQEAAAQLAAVDFLPLLEESPADRGGHFWLIFDALVDAAAAREQVLQIAPGLKDILEYWPGPATAKGWNRVRLPGAYYCRTGKYVERDVKGWCKLVNVATGETSHDGQSAAALLLASQTPAAILATIQSQDEQEQTPASIEEHEPEARTIVRSQDTSQLTEKEQALGYKLPKVDAKWEAAKGNGPIETTTRYFAIMPQYAAMWFNKYHTLESIRPKERNGMALSPNGNERTASTSYHITADGERFTDHSAHGQRSDGTKDSGDALELAVKVWGKSKWQLIGETSREIMNEATAAMESAARAGKPLPGWLEEPCIITPAGRKRYQYLLAQTAKQVDAKIEQFTEQFVQQEEIKPLLTELGKAMETERTRTEQPIEQISDYPDLREGMKVNTPAGIATITSVRQCPILKKPRCSVHTSTVQPDGSHFAAFNLSEVTPISQGTLLL